MPSAARLGLALTLVFLLLATLLAVRELSDVPDAVERDEDASDGVELRDVSPDDPHLRGAAPPPEAAGAPVDLDAVDRVRDLSGRVVDGDGRPIPGALLETVTYPARRFPSITVGNAAWEAAVGASTSSAVDGTFAIRLEPHAECCLRASKSGYAPVEFTRLRAGERVDVVLRPAVALQVRVYDEAGQPIEGCRLRLFRPWYGDAVAYEHLGITDDAGEYRFENLPPGGLAWLEPSAPHHGSRAWKRVTIPDTGEDTKTVTLPTGRALRGRVTDAATEQPVAGARVGIGRDFRRAVETSEDGRYVLEGWVSRSSHCLYVQADGYALAQARVCDNEVLDFALLAERVLEGRVVDGTGAPVAGAYVAAVGHHLHSDLMTEFSTATDRTDDLGRFELHGLRRDLFLQLIVRAAGHGRGVMELGKLGSDAAPWDVGDVPLPPSRRLTGHVVDAANTPVARLYVYLTGPDVPKEAWRPSVPNYGRGAGAYTDDLGRFSFLDLPPGDYRIGAGRGAARVEQDLVVLPDRDVTGLEVRLHGAERWTVRVEDHAGDPVAGIPVSVRLSDGRYVSGPPTDETGRTVFEADTRPESVAARLLAAASPRFAPTSEVPWPEDAFTVVIRLEPALVLSGVVQDAKGQPLPSAQILANQGQQEQRVWTDSNGRFRISFADRRPVGLVVTGVCVRVDEAGGNRAVRLPVEARRTVRPPQEDLTLTTTTLPTTASLTIVVVDYTGRPVEGAILGFLPGLLLPTSPLVADAEGRAIIQDIDERTFDVYARPPPHHPLRLAPGWAREVVPDGRELVIRLEALIDVTGMVLGPDGAPVEGASVRVDAPGVRGSIETNTNGRFFLALLPEYAPATLVAEYAPDSGIRWTGRVEGVGPDLTEVTIRLLAE